MKWKRRARGCLIVGAVLAVIVTILAWPWLRRVDVISESRKLDARLATAKDLGLPFTASELLGPPPPASQNAADLLFGAARLAERHSQDLEDVETLLRDVEPDLDFLAKDLSKLEPVVDEARKAAAKPRLWFDDGWNEPATMVFRSTQPLDLLRRILAARANGSALLGDARASAESLRVARQISRLLAQVPSPVHLFLATKFASAATIELDDAVGALPELVRADLEPFLENLDEPASQFDPRPALRGDFYSSLSIFRNLDRYGGFRARFQGEASLRPRAGIPLKTSGPPKGVLERAAMSQIARRSIQAMNVIGRSGPIEIADVRALDSQRVSSGGISEDLAMFYAVPVEPLLTSVLRAQSHERLARIYGELMRIRVRDGAFPKPLPPFGEDAVDPFTEKPFAYWRTEAGFALVGADPRGAIADPTERRSAAAGPILRYPPVVQKAANVPPVAVVPAL